MVCGLVLPLRPQPLKGRPMTHPGAERSARRVTRPLYLQGLKARSKRSETQRPEPQPRQSED